MIDWNFVIFAFFTGMTIIFLFEARRRFRLFDRRWGFAMGVGTIVFAMFIVFQFIHWQRLDSVIQTELPMASFVDQEFVQGSAVDAFASPLPPPSIFVFTTTVPIATATAVPQPKPAVLSIPDLEIEAAIVDVPLQNDVWDVSNLGEHVGRLAGVGQNPGDELAMVFVGHMTFPSSRNLVEGAFANLQYAIYDTQLFLDINDERLTYEVVEISRVDPSDVDRLLVADGDSILLVTCTDWDENGRVYASRLLVRAERVESDEVKVMSAE